MIITLHLVTFVIISIIDGLALGSDFELVICGDVAVYRFIISILKTQSCDIYIYRHLLLATFCQSYCVQEDDFSIVIILILINTSICE